MTAAALEIRPLAEYTAGSSLHTRKGDDSDSATFASLRSLLEAPASRQTATEIVHRLAYEGRAIAVCAPDKAGKSSLLATAAAHVSTGRSFLHRPVCRGAVLWAGLEEHISDAVQRFADLGADPDQIDLVVEKPERLLDRIAHQLAKRTYVWMALDSVSEYARVVSGGTPPSEGDTSGWSGIARPLVDLCHGSGVAMTALHHVRRDGEERGSTELFASFDAIWIMKRAGSQEHPTVRRFHGRGRRGIDVSPFALRLEGKAYQLLGGAADLSIDSRILLHVEKSPGISTNKLRHAVGGRASEVDKAIAELERRGAIQNHGSRVGAAWATTSPPAQGEMK